MLDVSLNDLTLKLLCANKSQAAETKNLYNCGRLHNLKRDHILCNRWYYLLTLIKSLSGFTTKSTDPWLKIGSRPTPPRLWCDLMRLNYRMLQFSPAKYHANVLRPLMYIFRFQPAHRDNLSIHCCRVQTIIKLQRLTTWQVMIIYM